MVYRLDLNLVQLGDYFLPMNEAKLGNSLATYLGGGAGSGLFLCLCCRHVD